MEPWTWDPAKAERNWRDHRVRFETAVFALADPLALTLPDPHADEVRWRTLGMVGARLLFVVHTDADAGAATPGRIISARRATREERTSYEEG